MNSGKKNLIAFTCAWAVSLIGLVALAGWIFNIESLKSVLPGLVTMKANTAMGFILSGISINFLAAGPDNRIKMGVSMVTAGLVFLIGAATAYEYILSMDLGIDQLFFMESAGAVGTLDPGRMAPTTALCFTLAGIALYLLNFGRAVTAAQILVSLVGFIGLANLLGYTYGIRALYGIGQYTQMAVHTSAAFILLGVSGLMVKKDVSIAGILSGAGLGSVSARRLLPVAFILPIAIAYFRIKGERLGLYPSDFGVGLVALSYIIIFGVAVIWSAAVLNKTDKARSDTLLALKETSQKLQISTDEWKRTFDSISDMIFIIDKDNNIINANKSFLDVIKKPIDWVRSKKCYEIMHKSNAPWQTCPLEKTKKDHIVHIEEVDDPNIGIPLLVTTSPIFDRSGNFVGAVHIAKDISAQKKTEEEMRKRIFDLERFQKVTVDRELKMKELKARMTDLESKLEKGK